MKDRHEQRIQLVTAMGPDRQSHVVLYAGQYRPHAAPLSFKKATQAMVLDRYPAEPCIITSGCFNSALQDRESPPTGRLSRLN